MAKKKTATTPVESSPPDEKVSLEEQNRTLQYLYNQEYNSSRSQEEGFLHILTCLVMQNGNFVISESLQSAGVAGTVKLWKDLDGNLHVDLVRNTEIP